MRLAPPSVREVAPRNGRRLWDKILVAFHHACDLDDLETAEAMLQTLELMLARETIAVDTHRRRNIEGFVAAHERLWHLRYPQPRA